MKGALTWPGFVGAVAPYERARLSGRAAPLLPLRGHARRLAGAPRSADPGARDRRIALRAGGRPISLPEDGSGAARRRFGHVPQHHAAVVAGAALLADVAVRGVSQHRGDASADAHALADALVLCGGERRVE